MGGFGLCAFESWEGQASSYWLAAELLGEGRCSHLGCLSAADCVRASRRHLRQLPANMGSVLGLDVNALLQGAGLQLPAQFQPQGQGAALGQTTGQPAGQAQPVIIINGAGERGRRGVAEDRQGLVLRMLRQMCGRSRGAGDCLPAKRLTEPVLRPAS